MTCICVKSIARCFVLFQYFLKLFTFLFTFSQNSDATTVEGIAFRNSITVPMLCANKTISMEGKFRFEFCLHILILFSFQKNLFHLQDTLINLPWDDQDQLLNETIRLESVRKYPLDRNYMVRFLRYVIEALESQNTIEVHDDFYTLLCDFQSKSDGCDSEYSYKHYQVLIEETTDSNGRIETVILKENRNKISNGTTGLNVWESALAISDWAIENRCQIDGKHILELGSGTGLSSLIIGKCCSPKTIHITDGNDRVIENLIENVTNNFEKLTNDQGYCHVANKTTVGKCKTE